MIEIIRCEAKPYVNLSQNKNTKRERYIVEKVLRYPGDEVGRDLWYHQRTFYKERHAQRYAHNLLGKVRVLRVPVGEIYREGWDKS